MGMDPNNNFIMKSISSPHDIHRISLFDWYYNLDTMGRFFDTIRDVDYWYHAFTYIVV